MLLLGQLQDKFQFTEEGNKLTNKPLTLIEINGLTGLEVVRELTAKEIKEREDLATKTNLFQIQQEEKEKARQSALAKLAKLGLTEEEIAAL